MHAGSAVAARGPQSTGSAVAAHGLSCSAACGIFCSRDRTMSSALQGGFLATGPSGLFLKSQWHIFLISYQVSQRHHLVSNSSRSLSSGEGWSASQYFNWGEFHLNELLRNGWSHPEVESSMSPKLNGHSIPICGMEVRNGISMKALGAYGCFVKLKQLKASIAFFFFLSFLISSLI